MILSSGLLLLAGATCWLGMALLALSQPRNWRTVGLGGEIESYARRLGWGLVVMSLIAMPMILLAGIANTYLRDVEQLSAVVLRLFFFLTLVFLIPG